MKKTNPWYGMSVKAFSLVLIFVFFSGFALAQYGLADYEQVIEFKSQKLYVIRDGDNVKYDSVLEDAFKRYWTFNEYEVVTIHNNKEFKLYKDQNVFDKYTVTYETGQTRWLAIVGNHRTSHAFVTVPVNGSIDQAFILPNLIQSMQNYLYFITEKPENTKGKKGLQLGFLDYASDHYAESLTDLMTKELWIPEPGKPSNYYPFMTPAQEKRTYKFSIEEFKKIYPYKARLVTEDSITKAIDEQREDIVYCYFTHHAIFLIEPKGGKTIFFSLSKKDRRNYLYYNYGFTNQKLELIMEELKKHMK